MASRSVVSLAVAHPVFRMARTYESLLDYAYSSDWWSELLLSVMEEYADTAGPYQNCPHPTRPRLMELSPCAQSLPLWLADP